MLQLLKRRPLVLSIAVFIIYLLFFSSSDKSGLDLNSNCPPYTTYSKHPHPPYSDGPLKLPSMRPPPHCRTFKSSIVDDYIDSFQGKFLDDDLFTIFKNTLPNTLDTTILWHDSKLMRTFISTGDIHAEWLRDSTRQLLVYIKFINDDPDLRNLIKGAILQQAEYIIVSPYCNAFQPSKHSKISRKPSSIDSVRPVPDWDYVFECKWELDSLASFFNLLNDYVEKSKDFDILNETLVKNAIKTITTILEIQSKPTFNKNTGRVLPFNYLFQRETNIGSETLPLSGSGNPVNSDTGLIRSAFRPSDDACIFQFLIPSNIYMFTQLNKIVPLLSKMERPIILNSIIIHEKLEEIAKNINKGIQENAIINHPLFGQVYAYEVDGYGSYLLMDDANLPSLLSLPDLGYTEMDDQIYLNTREMILSKNGNPYFIKGKFLQGIGGPHVGLNYAWHMSLLVQIRTSDDDDEILKLLESVKSTTAGLGLMHEGVDVNYKNGKLYTRSWFSWCNSEFGNTMMDLIERKPYLILKE